jgi:hypothetical protein
MDEARRVFWEDYNEKKMREMMKEMMEVKLSKIGRVSSRLEL